MSKVTKQNTTFQTFLLSLKQFLAIMRKGQDGFLEKKEAILLDSFFFSYIGFYTPLCYIISKPV
jgi:hypothetical protein